MPNKESAGYKVGLLLGRIIKWSKENSLYAMAIAGAVVLIVMAVFNLDSSEDKKSTTGTSETIELSAEEKREQEEADRERQAQERADAIKAEEEKTRSEAMKPLVFSNVSWTFENVRNEKLSSDKRVTLVPKLTFTADVTNNSDVQHDTNSLPRLSSEGSSVSISGIVPPHETAQVSLEIEYTQMEEPRTFSFTEGEYTDWDYRDRHRKAEIDDYCFKVPFEGLDGIAEKMTDDFADVIARRESEQDAINTPLFQEELERDRERREAAAQEEEAYLGTTCWVTPTGTQYHKDPDCSYIHDRSALTTMTVGEARDAGYGACDRCAH